MSADQSSCQGKMSVQLPHWGKNALHKPQNWPHSGSMCVYFYVSGPASLHPSPACYEKHLSVGFSCRLYFAVMYFPHQSAVMDWVLKVSDRMRCKCVYDFCCPGSESGKNACPQRTPCFISCCHQSSEPVLPRHPLPHLSRCEVIICSSLMEKKFRSQHGLTIFT